MLDITRNTYIELHNHVGVDKYFTIIWHLLQVCMIFAVKLHPVGPVKMGELFIDSPYDNN